MWSWNARRMASPRSIMSRLRPTSDLANDVRREDFDEDGAEPILFRQMGIELPSSDLDPHCDDDQSRP